MAQSGSIEAESVARAAGQRAAARWPKELFQVSSVCFSIIINLVRFVNVRLRIDPRRLAYFSAWTVKLETRAQRTTPTVMGWVCIFEKEEFPKSQRKLYWLWILFQFGAGKTQQHFAASIIMYIYILSQGRITNAASGICRESSEGRLGAWWIVRDAQGP